jgi:glycosyltransferase involved in cell wall biosynthesis
MKNIVYFKKISEIGGTESFLYYLARKYQDLDITIYYNDGDANQIARLKKYVRVKQYKGEKLKCEKIFINYYIDEKTINNIEAKEYIQIIHTDYKKQELYFRSNPKITKYIAVTQVVADSFKEYTGLECEVCYNPLILDKPKKVLRLISATRLTKEKGKTRMIQFAKMLDDAGIPYIWTVFTNGAVGNDNPNMIYLKPKLDISDYIADADYLVQLSEDGEGYGYTTAEALSLGTPVIVTKNQAFIEIGVKDGENGFLVDFDLSNVDCKKIYESNLKFKYEPPKDNWSELLVKGESQYKKDLKTMVKVKPIIKYHDIELNKILTTDTKPFTVNKVRADDLVSKGLVEYFEEKKEVKHELVKRQTKRLARN